MALKLGSLFYDVDANTTGLRKAEGVVKRTNQKMASSFKRLGAVIAAVFTIDLVRRTLLIADRMKLLDARIRNLTKSTKEFVKVQQELLRISNRTGVSMDGVVSAFQRFSLVKKIVGANQKEMIRFTETITKLGIISGATAQEVRATSIQIGQAIGANFEAGAQEINSINEQMPQVARAVEKSLGIIAGSFKKEFAEGGRSGKEFFDAILKASAEADERFKVFPLTIERAMNALQNNTNQAIKRLNNAASVTGFIADGIQKAAKFMRDDFDRSAFNALETLRKIRALFSGIGKIIDNLTGTVDSFSWAWDMFVKSVTAGSNIIANRAITGFIKVKQTISDLWNSVRASVAIAKIQFSALTDDISSRFKIAALHFKIVFPKAFAFILKKASFTFTKIAEGFAKIGLDKLAADAMNVAKSMKTFGDAAVENTQRAIDAEKVLRKATFDGANKRIKAIEDEKTRLKELAQAVADSDIENIKRVLNEIRSASDERIRIFEEEQARLRELAAGELEDDSEPSLLGDKDEEDVVSKLEKLKASMGDETQAILNELAKRNDAIKKLEKIGADERRDLLVESERIKNAQLLELEKNRQITSLNALSAFNDQFAQVLERGGKEHTAIMKAIFLAQKAIQVAIIIAETQVAAAKAVGQLGVFGIPVATMLEATGYARAAMVAGLAISDTFGGGRVAGGQVSPGLLHPVTENGEPELLLQGSKQFLLPGKGGEIVPGSAMAVKGGGGTPNITIINEGDPLEVTGTEVTRDEVIVMVTRAENNAVARVDSSLAGGRGSTASALTMGYKAERNVK